MRNFCWTLPQLSCRKVCASQNTSPGNVGRLDSKGADMDQYVQTVTAYIVRRASLFKQSLVLNPSELHPDWCDSHDKCCRETLKFKLVRTQYSPHAHSGWGYISSWHATWAVYLWSRKPTSQYVVDTVMDTQNHVCNSEETLSPCILKLLKCLFALYFQTWKSEKPCCSHMMTQTCEAEGATMELQQPDLYTRMSPAIPNAGAHVPTQSLQCTVQLICKGFPLQSWWLMACSLWVRDWPAAIWCNVSAHLARALQLEKNGIFCDAFDPVEDRSSITRYMSSDCWCSTAAPETPPVVMTHPGPSCFSWFSFAFVNEAPDTCSASSSGRSCCSASTTPSANRARFLWTSAWGSSVHR